MDDIQVLVNIFGCLTQNDENIRVPAEKKLIELLEKNVVHFTQLILILLQNSSNFPSQIIHAALLYTRRCFRSAMKAKKSNDPSMEYLLIPIEIANNYLEIIFSMCSIPEVSNFAANLLGQITSYLLCFDPQSPVLSMICQQMNNQAATIPCCIAIQYIFQEIDLDPALQAVVLNTIMPLFNNPNVSFSIKGKLLEVITTMIPNLSSFLNEPNKCENLAQSALSLTEIPELKLASYDFWDEIAFHYPNIFQYAPRIIELSINDLKDPNQDEHVINLILTMWDYIGKVEMKDPETLSNMLTQVIPVLLPLCLSIAENIFNPQELDKNDDWYPHIAVRECILSLTTAMKELSFDILFSYANQFINSDSSIKREISLFCFETCINSYFDEPTDNWKNIYNQCIQISVQNFGNHSIRVVSQAVRLLNSVIVNDQELMDYTQFVPPLLQLMSTPLADDAKLALESIITTPSFHNGDEIFNNLLSIENQAAFDCAYKILKSINNPNFSQAFLSKCIALCEILAEDQGTLELLPLSILMAINMIDTLKAEAIQYFGRFLPFLMQCYDQLHLPEALRGICSIVHISGQHIQYAVNQVLIQLNNDGSYIMKLTAISSISAYLSSCNISQQFHEIMRILLEMLESSLDLSLKDSIIEAINSLHSSFPSLMQPLFERLINICGYFLTNIQRIIDTEEKLAFNINSGLLEEIKLLFMNGAYNNYPILIQMALSGIQNALQINIMKIPCMGDILDLLSILLKINPTETKQYITSNSELNQLLMEAKEIEALVPSINNLMNQLST